MAHTGNSNAQASGVWCVHADVIELLNDLKRRSESQHSTARKTRGTFNGQKRKRVFVGRLILQIVKKTHIKGSLDDGCLLQQALFNCTKEKMSEKMSGIRRWDANRQRTRGSKELMRKINGVGLATEAKTMSETKQWRQKRCH
jgi:hypothetical protein